MLRFRKHDFGSHAKIFKYTISKFYIKAEGINIYTSHLMVIASLSAGEMAILNLVSWCFRLA